MKLLNPDLLLLSGQIALLVLLGSILAFGLGWFFHAVLRASSPVAATAAPTIDRGGEEIGAAPLETPARPASATLESSDGLRRDLAETERQCVEALEQRDEAERQTVLRATELRQLKEEMARLQRESVSQAEHQKVIQALEAAKAILAAAPLPEVVEGMSQQIADTRSELDARTLQHEAALREAEALRTQLEVLAREKAELEATLKARPEAVPLAMPGEGQARQTLGRIQSELAGWDQKIEAFAREHEQRREELEAMQKESGPVAAVRAAAKAELAAKAKLADARENRERCGRQIRALERSLAQMADAGAKADDLTLIKGIKGVINGQLNGVGIFSYQQIAGWDEEEVQAFSEMLAFKNRVRRDRWQEQARELMQAKGPSLPS